MKSFLIGVIRDSWIYSEISHNLLDNSTGFLLLCNVKGPLTQAVEYLPFKQRVAGSSPVRPTKKTWNIGVLEHWSNGLGFLNSCIFLPILQYSITPFLHIVFTSPSSSPAKDIPVFHRGNRPAWLLGSFQVGIVFRNLNFRWAVNSGGRVSAF